MGFKQTTENLFEFWSEKVVSHRWLALCFALLFAGLVIPQIRNGWVDVSIESYLPHGNQTMVQYNEFRRQFDYTMGAVLAIETPDGIFNLPTLEKIKKLHEQIEAETPYLKKIISLVNVRHTYATEDMLSVDDLYESWPKTEAEIPAFKKMVMSNPNYVKALVSEDGRYTSLVIEQHVYSSQGQEELDVFAGFDDGFEDGFGDSLDNGLAEKPTQEKLEYLTSDEEKEFSAAIIRIAQQYSSPEFTIYSAGGPIMNYIMTVDMETSTYRATMLGFVIIIVLLAFLFRRLSGVLMPLVVVMMSLMTTMAFYPILGYAFNGNTQIIPTFVLAVGIADSVHILSIFYKHYDSGMSKHDAIVLTMKQTSIAVLMTTITTAASLLSFLVSEMVPTKSMGIFGAIGVVMALFYTLVLLPCLLAILPIKHKKPREDGKKSWVLGKIDMMIHACGNLGVTHAKGIVALTAGLSVFFLIGVLKIQFSHDPVKWYQPEDPLRKSIEKIDENTDGSLAIQILLMTDKANTLHDPEFLQALEEIETVAENHRYKTVYASDAVSILSVVKETHQALNNNDPDYFKIPETRQAIAQELLLFENSGSDDIYDFTDNNFSIARIDLQIPWSNSIYFRSYIKGLKEKIEAVLEKHQLDNVEVRAVGLLTMMSENIMAMLFGTVESYLIAFCLVAILMFLLMENIRRGLLAFSPNITPILFTVGFMGWIGLPLNMFSSLIGCVIIGISVDDTIHFMHHFRRFSSETRDVRKAVHQTLDLCGRAITFTSIVLIGGFIVHLTGILSVNHEFGYLLSIAIFLALFANLILAPALMTLFWHAKEKKLNS